MKAKMKTKRAKKANTKTKKRDPEVIKTNDEPARAHIMGARGRPGDWVESTSHPQNYMPLDQKPAELVLLHNVHNYFKHLLYAHDYSNNSHSNRNNNDNSSTNNDKYNQF